MTGKIKALAIPGAVAFALALAGVYAWDSVASDGISKGVRVGGIEVGALPRSEAERVLRTEVVEPLMRPLEVSYRDSTFRLTPERLEMAADVEGMLDAAREASRSGGVVGRLWRRLTGAELERDLPPRVTWSRRSLVRFVSEVAAKVDRPAQEATVTPGPGGLAIVPAQAGHVIRKPRLRQAIERGLQAPLGDRRVPVRLRRVEPTVTDDQLPERYPFFITVDRAGFKLRFYRDLELVRTFTISVGRVGFDTPTGLYHIQNKAVDAAWHVPDRPWAGKLRGKVIPGGHRRNPLKARWMGIYDGVGIHGTDAVGALGSAASHGCIRMAVPEVIELYDQAPVSTPVYIG